MGDFWGVFLGGICMCSMLVHTFCVRIHVRIIYVLGVICYYTYIGNVPQCALQVPQE